MFLQEYNFQVIHCSGSENIEAEVLSRYPPFKQLNVQPILTGDINISLVKINGDLSSLRKYFLNMRTDQLNEKWMRDKIVFLKTYERYPQVLTKQPVSIQKWYLIHEGI